MSGEKRALDVEDLALPTERGPKRSRLDDDVDEAGGHNDGETTTEAIGVGVTVQVYHRFQENRGLQMPMPQFIGLCAYLCTILRWGFTANVRELDQFVLCYPAFEAWLPEFEKEHASAPTLQYPSYHQWFREQASSDEQCDPDLELILTEATLRQIWQENPYTFMYAEESLTAIAHSAISRQALSELEALEP